MFNIETTFYHNTRKNTLFASEHNYAPLQDSKIVHDNSDNNQKQINEANCQPQILEPQNKEHTRQKPKK